MADPNTLRDDEAEARRKAAGDATDPDRDGGRSPADQASDYVLTAEDHVEARPTGPGHSTDPRRQPPSRSS